MAIVTIVGRPNVGKSSLFNRLTGRRNAIVDNMPGVTRDRIYGEVEWREKSFFVVDTGGLIVNEDHPLMDSMKRQIQLAVDESDLILLVIDGQSGSNWMDEDVAMLLRRTSKPVIVVANKLDDLKHDEMIYEAYGLGFEKVIGISALHKRNIYELCDLILENLPEEEIDAQDEKEIRVAIVGRPNVGKSSIVNYLTGQERSIVSEIPGTTRDAVDSVIYREDLKYRIVDTAGLRRRSRVKDDLEYYSLVRTLEAIGRCDVAVLVMDSSEPFTDQDKKLASHIVEKGKGLVLLMNKWDLLPKRDKAGDKMIKDLKEEMVFVKHAPVLFASALTGRGLEKLYEKIESVYINRQRRISTNILNRMVRDILAFERLPSDGKGKFFKIYYCTQSDIEPPTFVFFVNDPNIVNNPFQGHLEKELRGLADFEGVPIRIFWRPKA